MTSIYKPDDKLPPIEELLNLGIVTEEDIDEAVQKWIDNPPDEEFAEVLEAEEN